MDRKYKPKYYKYLKFLDQHSIYHILDIHILIRKYKPYPMSELNKLVKNKDKFNWELDIVDIIILDNENRP